MGMIEKLDYLMAQRKMNKNILSKETGIPYTTIDGYYKRGTDNIKLSNLKKISEFFNVTLDYLVDDDISVFDVQNSECTVHEKTETYYVNEDAAEYAQEIANNNDLKMLFDASRNVSKEDLQFVVEMIKKLKRN